MVKVKTARKDWYQILAPKVFRNVVLGESLVYEPEQMIGKGINQNLMSLTNDIKKQNISIHFEVVNVENGKGNTNIIGYHMLNSSVKRLVRRNISKIDMSFVCQTADKKNIRIKPLLITRLETSGSIGAKLQKNTKEFLTKYIGELSYDNFTSDLIGHKLQDGLRAHLKKVYPLKVCEIRVMEFLKVYKAEPESEAEAAKHQKKTKQEDNAIEAEAQDEVGAEEPQDNAEEVEEPVEEVQ